uniref:Tyrosine-protein phosphatase domain-containing protein n=1 Tax=Panagrolaimus superbus TaxID=310955 RepID=A0A914YHA0_9BILA
MKNPYRSIECIDNERVVLKGPGEAYIHANFIKNLDGKKLFIGTQGPTRDSAPDFWRMVVQEKSTVIIMLCNIFEEDEKDGNIKEKSVQYWPSTVGKSFKYDDLEVSCLEIVEISYGVEGQIIVTTTLELIKS